MGQKVGSFHRIKNKEQGRDQQKNTWLSGVTQSGLLGVRRNKEVSIEPRVGLVFGDWLTGYATFLIKQTVTGTQSYLTFNLLTWHSGQEHLHLRSGKLFQQKKERQRFNSNN